MLGHKIYSSNNVVALNPKSSLILSSNKKPIIGPRGKISIIDPHVINLV